MLGPYKSDREPILPIIPAELARLVSSLLLGTRAILACFLLKTHFQSLEFSGFDRSVFLMTRTTHKELASTNLKTNLLNVNHVEYKQDFKNRFLTELDKS